LDKTHLNSDLTKIIKTPILRIKIIAGVLLLLLECCQAFCQDYYTITLPDSLSALDLVKDTEGFLKVIDRNGIYQLNGRSLELNQKLPYTLSRLSSIHKNGDNFIYANSNKGFTELTSLGKILNHNLPVDQSVLSRLNDNQFLLLSKHIFSISDGKCSSLSTSQFDKNWNLFFNENQMYVLDGSNTLLSYDPDIGIDTISILDSDETISFFHVENDKIYFANCSTFYEAQIENNQFYILNSVSLPSNNCVIDLIVFENKIIVLSALNIFSIDNASFEIESIEQNLSDWEEMLAIESYGQGAFWLLSNKSLSLQTDLRQEYFELEETPASPVSFYRIRAKEYISDGQKVYKKNDANSEWQHDLGKAAPRKVISHLDIHPILIFDDFFLQIHNENALILNRTSLDKSQKYNDIKIQDDGVLLLSNQGFYKSTKQGVHELHDIVQNYYSIHETDLGTLVHAENAIYQYIDSDLSIFLTLDIPLKKIKIVDADMYGLSYQNQLLIEDLKTKEEVIADLGNIKVLDFILDDNKIIVLSEKSILIYDRKSLSNGNANLLQLIPFQSDGTTASIINYSNNIIRISSKSIIHELEVPPKNFMELPKIKIEKAENNNYNIVHTNHWTDNVKFNYYFSGESQNEAVWTSESVIESASIKGDFESMVVSMSDDLFGQSISSKSFKLAPRPAGLNYLYYLIMLMIIFASGFLGMRLLWTS